VADINDPITFEKMSEVSREASKLNDVRIIRLPPMRVITSRHKTGETENLDGDKMQNLFVQYGFIPTPGLRDCFMRKESSSEWVMLMKIPNDYENETIYMDENLPGGLYAVASTFFENMDDTFAFLREWASGNNDFQLDNERSEMLEEILPWDIVNKLGKWQQDIFIPIKIIQKGIQMPNNKIEPIFNEVLTGGVLKNALDFTDFLNTNDIIQLGQHEWYYKDKCVCYIDTRNEKHSWIVWTEGDYTNEHEGFTIDERTKEIAWASVMKCGSCEGCNFSPGITKMLLGKEFANICNADNVNMAFMFTNPENETLECVKMLVLMRINIIANHK